CYGGPRIWPSVSSSSTKVASPARTRLLRRVNRVFSDTEHESSGIVKVAGRAQRPGPRASSARDDVERDARAALAQTVHLDDRERRTPARAEACRQRPLPRVDLAHVREVEDDLRDRLPPQVAHREHREEVVEGQR